MVATGMFLGTKWRRRDRQFPHRNGVKLRSSGVTIAVGDTAGVVWVTRASGSQGWARRPVREAYTPRGLDVQFLRRYSCSSSGSRDRRTLSSGLLHRFHFTHCEQVSLLRDGERSWFDRPLLQ
uniref:(northern house mosquito) hypothetical protein n=1 Tax=Culex pipiens TaxID=7175 RepID=A0A8D8NLF3_CULPI